MPAAFNCKIIAIFDFLLSIGMVPGLNHDLDDDPSDRDRRKVPSLGSFPAGLALIFTKRPFNIWKRDNKRVLQCFYCRVSAPRLWRPQLPFPVPEHGGRGFEQ
jgi:hypothetical protein